MGDATNVNNWHWTEKNADSWSKKKIRELFTNHIIEDPEAGRLWIEGVEKCEGEARVNNRKGRVILFYEWDIVLFWKGNVKESRYLLGLYVTQLMSEYSTGVVLPRKGETEGTVKEIPRKVKTVPPVDRSVWKKTEKDVKKSDTQKKKKPLKKEKSWKSNDLVFYVSLLSIVGISSVLVIKLARSLK